MKKAGQYFKEACNKHEADQKSLKKDLYDEPYFVDAIKQAQIDAINCTVAAILERKRTDFFLSNEAIIEEQKKLKEKL